MYKNKNTYKGSRSRNSSYKGGRSDNRSNKPTFRSDKLRFLENAEPQTPRGGNLDKIQDHAEKGYAHNLVSEPKAILVRKFDQVVDFITNRTITGYDPIFGKSTPRHNIVYANSTRLMMTSENENKYLRDELHLRMATRRYMERYTRGIDLFRVTNAATFPTTAGFKQSIAGAANTSSVSQIVSSLQAELFYGPLQNVLSVSYTVNSNAGLKTIGIPVGSDITKEMTALQAYLLGYDTDVTALAEFIKRFDNLKAVLPMVNTKFYSFQTYLS